MTSTEKLLAKAQEIQLDLLQANLEVERLDALRGDMILALREDDCTWRMISDAFGLNGNYAYTLADKRERQILKGAKQRTLDSFLEGDLQEKLDRLNTMLAEEKANGETTDSADE